MRRKEREGRKQPTETNQMVFMPAYFVLVWHFDGWYWEHISFRTSHCHPLLFLAPLVHHHRPKWLTSFLFFIRRTARSSCAWHTPSTRPTSCASCSTWWTVATCTTTYRSMASLTNRRCASTPLKSFWVNNKGSKSPRPLYGSLAFLINNSLPSPSFLNERQHSSQFIRQTLVANSRFI